MLQTNQIKIREIEEIGSPLIRGQIVLLECESHSLGIGISGLRVIDWHCGQLCRTVLCGNCVTQVSGKGRDPTLTGKIVANNGDSARQPCARLRGRRYWTALPRSHKAPL